MKLLFYFYKFAPTNPAYATQAISFRAHAEDLIAGLKSLGHEIRHIPIVETSDAEKERIYREFQPDLVITVECWKSHLATTQHALDHGMSVLPYLVSDGWVDSYYSNLLNKVPRIVVPSDWVKHVFQRDGVTQSDIVVVKESVDTRLFSPPADSEKGQIQQWRRSRGIAEAIRCYLLSGEKYAAKVGIRLLMQ